jgi:uroporphyrinogen-III synthase
MGWLANKTVVVFESRFSDELASLIERKGARVIKAPALSEIHDPQHETVRRFVEGACRGEFAGVVFLTGVGCRTCLEAAASAGMEEEFLGALWRMTVICRGPKPVAVLRRKGLEPTAVAPEPHTTAELVSLLGSFEEGLRGRRVALQHYGEINADVRARLESLGADVFDVHPYRWALPSDTSALEDAIRRILAGQVDAVCFTSRPQVLNLVEMAEQMGVREQLVAVLGSPGSQAGRGANAEASGPGDTGLVVAAVGPVVAATLRSVGIQPTVEPSRPKMGDLVRCLDNEASHAPVSDTGVERRSEPEVESPRDLKGSKGRAPI